MTMLQAAGYTRLIGGKYWVPAEITDEGEILRLKFGFNRPLLTEIKAMAGARWDPDTKSWTVKNCERNWFQMAFLAGENPYAHYDRPLVPMEFQRPLYTHQKDLAQHGFTYRHGIWAAEMGTGKSLASFEIMEHSLALESKPYWLYVGPKSAIASYELEMRKWGCRVFPEIVTYDGLKRLVENWPRGKKAPFGVIFDESSRLKNHTAQRTVAASHLAAAIRRDWPDYAGFVLLMSGSPAPKGPADWYSQCEIAQPGFIKEGTVEKFKARLGLIVNKESITGGTYPHHVTWWDDERKCKTCGQGEDYKDHDPEAALLGGQAHPYEKSKNEIAYLYQRMKGLVLVKFKRDCLAELPEKRFRVIRCPPTQAILNAAKLIVAGASTTIGAITLLRELSDGFQYVEKPAGMETCPTCKGACEVDQPVPIVDQGEINTAMAALEEQAGFDAEGMPVPEHLLVPDKFEIQKVPCWECGGEGKIQTYTRSAEQTSCPKDRVFMDIIDSHDEDGRLVAYGGFTGSIERMIAIADKMKWEWIKVDGHGWRTSPGIKALKPVDMLQVFQDKSRAHPRVLFLGQADAAGMGLTLTESWEIVYYSNSNKPEARQQSMDRIHRPGMDLNKGALITDIIHLPSDETVLAALTRSQKLQELSLGSFHDALKSMALTAERQT